MWKNKLTKWLRYIFGVVKTKEIKFTKKLQVVSIKKVNLCVIFHSEKLSMLFDPTATISKKIFKKTNILTDLRVSIGCGEINETHSVSKTNQVNQSLFALLNLKNTIATPLLLFFTSYRLVCTLQSHPV